MAYLSVDIDISKNKNGINLQNLKDYLISLENSILTVGVHKDAGIDNVKKMLWNEFGTNHRLRYNSVAIPNVGLKPINNKNSDLGEFVESGLDISIPARPVIRMSLYQDMKNQINEEYQLALNREKKTKLDNPSVNAEKTLSNLGQECVYMQREKMANGGFSQIDNKGKNTEANSDLTVRIKGFNHPYFETGELISKINYKVKK